MNTKVLMRISALFLGVIGVVLSFMPDEIAQYLGVEQNVITITFMKLMGALYLGFAILNWMANGTLIGGIYNRPIAIGNLMHFGVGAISLVKVLSSSPTHSTVFILLTVVYSLLAIGFGYVFRTNPSKPVHSQQ